MKFLFGKKKTEKKVVRPFLFSVWLARTNQHSFPVHPNLPLAKTQYLISSLVFNTFLAAAVNNTDSWHSGPLSPSDNDKLKTINNSLFSLFSSLRGT